MYLYNADFDSWHYFHLAFKYIYCLNIVDQNHTNLTVSIFVMKRFFWTKSNLTSQPQMGELCWDLRKEIFQDFFSMISYVKLEGKRREQHEEIVRIKEDIEEHDDKHCTIQWQKCTEEGCTCCKHNITESYVLACSCLSSTEKNHLG